MQDFFKVKGFYKKLLFSSLPAVALVLAVLAGYLSLSEQMIGLPWVLYVIATLALMKCSFIVRLTFSQLNKILGQSHYLIHVLFLFGLLISLIILSFTTDYLALYLLDHQHFKSNALGASPLYILFFEFFYFSLITFSTVGYGDIVALSHIAKLLVVMEVLLYFFVMVFGVANINRINIKDE
ncbi:ion channel [Gillisia sp. Hel_I_86]|uniref:potassium channel family protein n=1 Tax=Gillisia sp. Hel_I_86 TaxID=1249981 RepID=UPI0011996A48|nr:potassium channel family protein [Gillisia sp. Hel_I_86]TVZ28636.1 ion channel [Gillisia sp. Hel_I_86]